MSSTKSGNSVDYLDVIVKLDSPWSALGFIFLFLAVLLTTPLWIGPLIGISIGQGYLFLLIHGAVAITATALMKRRAKLLVRQRREIITSALMTPNEARKFLNDN